jgi:DnaK suppressor protein
MDLKVAKQKNGRYMKKQLIQMLLQKREEFQQQLKATEDLFRREIKEIPPTPKTHPADSDRQVSINGVRIIKLQKCLEKFDQALVRVEQGTYDFCPSCGDTIPIGRLNAVSFAKLCAPCKNGM